MSDQDTIVKTEAARWLARMQAEDSAADRPALDAWLAADPANRSEYEKLEKGLALSGGLADSDVYRNRPPLERFARSSWATPPRLAIAASLMVAILLSVFLLGRVGQQSDGVTVVAEASKVGEIRPIKLPDGSSVILDTDSKIEARFDSTSRRVRLLEGRARFDVTPDSSRVFVVEVAGRDVSVDGSRFDVQKECDLVHVQSLAGPVTVRPSSATSRFATYTVLTGQQLTFSGRDDRGRLISATAGSERWVEGMLVFQRTPLSDVLSETNRYSARHIVLKDQALGTLKVTGAFRPVPTNELAKELAAAFGLHVSGDAAGNTVLSKD